MGIAGCIVFLVVQAQDGTKKSGLKNVSLRLLCGLTLSLLFVLFGKGANGV